MKSLINNHISISHTRNNDICLYVSHFIDNSFVISALETGDLLHFKRSPIEMQKVMFWKSKSHILGSHLSYRNF